jgi:hypothetical protein
MVLLNSQTGMAVSADSQTGTWYEETAESQQAAAAPISSRSTALHSDGAEISRKAQRLDTSAPGLDDIALASMQERLNGSSMADQHRTTPSTPPAEPLIDDATRLLGISWQRVDTDNDMAPAVRGWTKYIDNQYAAYLHDSQMLMKNSWPPHGMHAFTTFDPLLLSLKGRLLSRLLAARNLPPTPSPLPPNPGCLFSIRPFPATRTRPLAAWTRERD